MKLLLVEDDPKLGPLLVRVLRAAAHDPSLAKSCADAHALARSGTFASAVIDWMLPDGDGLALIATLRGAGFDAPILLLTARSEVSDRVRGLDAGADDYLVKPFDVDELLARLRALQRRTATRAPVDLGDLHLDRNRRYAFLSGKLLSLTAREFDLLVHLAGRAGEVVPKSELLSSLWETDEFAPNLVEVLVSRLRDKLGEHAWMLQTARGSGYRLSSERSA